MAKEIEVEVFPVPPFCEAIEIIINRYSINQSPKGFLAIKLLQPLYQSISCYSRQLGKDAPLSHFTKLKWLRAFLKLDFYLWDLKSRGVGKVDLVDSIGIGQNKRPTLSEGAQAQKSCATGHGTRHKNTIGTIGTIRTTTN